MLTADLVSADRCLRGPIHEQVRAALRYIRNNVIREKVTKHPDRAEATRIFNYPFEAIEEALVNAVYHRGYDQREPVEVRVHPEAIYIISYPGPDPSIRTEDLTEGHCTGIPIMREAMAANGSPPPKFSTDDARTYFLWSNCRFIQTWAGSRPKSALSRHQVQDS